jgi:hypothetical protein
MLISQLCPIQVFLALPCVVFRSRTIPPDVTLGREREQECADAVVRRSSGASGGGSKMQDGQCGDDDVDRAGMAGRLVRWNAG